MLSLSAIVPLLIGMICAAPLLALLRFLWLNRSLRVRLQRMRLLNRNWQPVFLERYQPGERR